MLAQENNVVSEVLEAVHVLGNPASSQPLKREAHILLTKVKQSVVSITLRVAGELCRQKQDEVALFGYNLLCEVVRKRWKECSDQEKKDVATFAWKCLAKAGDIGPSKPICSSVCELSGLVLARDSQHSLAVSWKKVLELGTRGPRQFNLSCRVAQALCEQTSDTDEGIAPMEVKLESKMAQRCLVKNLSMAGGDTMAFFCKSIEKYYQQGVQLAKAGDQQNAAICAEVVSNGLEAICAFGDFVTLTKLEEAGVVHVCQGLVHLGEFRERVMNIIDKLVCRNDIDDSEVKVGIRIGAIALERLDRLHVKRREQQLDACERDYSDVARVVTAVSKFAKHYAERLACEENKLTQLLAQVLSFFKFKSVEIAAIALPFWAWILQLRTLNAASWGFKKALSVLSKDLTICMFGLYEHMQVAGDEDDKLQEHSNMSDFKDHHATHINNCLTSLTHVFPDSVRSHIAAAANAAVTACNNRSMKTTDRVILLRRLSLIVEHVSNGKAIEAEALKLALSDTLECLLQMEIGNQMELALWYGETLKCCTKAVRLNNDLTLSLITGTIKMLCRLPMGTAGVGLPLVSDAKYKTYAEARMSLCLVIRSLVEQTPAPMLLHIQKFRAKIEQAKKSQRLSITEYIAFAEVAILAVQSASVESQKEILEWTLEPIRSSWIKKDWIYRPSNEAAYGDIYLAYDLNPDASATMVGRDSRWELYYEIQLLSKVLSRCARKKWRYETEGAPESSIDPALDLVYVVGKITRSLQSLWEICKTHTVWKKVIDVNLPEETPATKTNELLEGLAVSGTSVESCRRWLEVILRKCGSILGSTGNACPSFWLNQHLSQRLPRLVTESVERMCLGPMKDLLEQVIIPWVKLCPPWRHDKWVLPALEVVPHIHKRIRDGWISITSSQDKNVEAEIAHQNDLQDVTEQFAKLLAALSLGLMDETRGTKTKSVFDGLLDDRSAQCRDIIQYSMDLLVLRNWSVVEPVAQFCRCVVAISHNHRDIQDLVTSEMLQNALGLLFDRNMAPVAGSLITLLGDILAKYLGSHRSVAECMMNLPGMTEMDLQRLAKNTIGGQKMKEHLQETLMACCGREMPALGLL